MKIKVPPGRYILAVSGGVDSMSLIDLLAGRPDLELIVAHFDHGIRPESSEDAELVTLVAKAHGLKIETRKAKLGPGTSEAKAREARYKFLEDLRRKYAADAIITAHHQDDMVETAFLNLLRGTGRRGLISIADSKSTIRPLLHASKEDIVKYAKNHNLKWNEDITNRDTKYLRNYIRHNVVSRLNPEQRKKLINDLENITKVDKALNKQIATLSHTIKTPKGVRRAAFAALPHEIGNELVRFWLREANAPDIDKKTIDRLNTAIRTAKSGTRHSIRAGLRMEVNQKLAHFTNTL